MSQRLNVYLFDSESEEHSSNYSSSQIAQVIRHITKDKLTLETIVPLIDNIIITQTKQLQGIYFKTVHSISLNNRI